GRAAGRHHAADRLAQSAARASYDAVRRLARPRAGGLSRLGSAALLAGLGGRSRGRTVLFERGVWLLARLAARRTRGPARPARRLDFAGCAAILLCPGSAFERRVQQR